MTSNVLSDFRFCDLFLVPRENEKLCLKEKGKFLDLGTCVPLACCLTHIFTALQGRDLRAVDFGRDECITRAQMHALLSCLPSIPL